MVRRGPPVLATEGGQTLIEFIATFGLFVLLFFAAFTLWYAEHAAAVVTDAAREAARAAAVAASSPSGDISDQEKQAAFSAAMATLRGGGLSVGTPAGGGAPTFNTDQGTGVCVNDQATFDSDQSVSTPCDVLITKDLTSHEVSVTVRYRDGMYMAWLLGVIGNREHEPFVSLESRVTFFDEQ